MEEVENLRDKLVKYVRRKFFTRRNIYDTADDVVNQTFLEVMKSPGYDAARLNFGYMSLACIRTAYKVFHKSDAIDTVLNLEMAMPLIERDDFVDEIASASDTDAILESLQVLKSIEQIIVKERYYGDFTFREISERHGINLNTVLTHHRRALEKLRPVLSLYFEYDKQATRVRK